MVSSSTKSYFFQSFLILVLSGLFFFGFKKFLPHKIFTEKTVQSKNVLIDKMLLEAYQAEKKANKNHAQKADTLANQPVTFFETNGITFPTEDYANYQGFQYLIPFYEKLYQLESTKQGNIRIAYYGDSMTDGDMIVQDFRQKFQETYGGKGVGFVSINSESAKNRVSIYHEYSQNWWSQNYLDVKKPIRSFGVNGHTFFANDTTNFPFVKFNASKYKFLTSLDNPTLFYGNSNNQKGQIFYKVANDTLRLSLETKNILNTATLSTKGLKSIKISFQNTKSIPFYGVNFDDGVGVHIDNFSKRGNSGIPISKFDVQLMNAFQEKLGYDLIVLHYGTNVLNYGSYDYNWYRNSMTKTVNRIKECFPGAAILIISTADKATKYDTEMKTDSAVVPLARAQKNYALHTQSGFINLYTLMGGDGSITKWVDEKPPLANKDYTHFNYLGAKKIAGLLYNKINEGYVQFKNLRSTQKLVSNKIILLKKDSIKPIPAK
jgi:hypothetical protein